MSAPALDDPAPDFTLPDREGKPVSLSEARGKRHVVIFFFPGAFTKTCTEEACELRDAVPRIGPLDAEVLGISRDPVEKLAAFTAKYHLENMRLLSDVSGEVSARFGALSLLGYSKRATFIVDKAGIIRWKTVQMPFSRPDTAEIERTLAGLAARP